MFKANLIGQKNYDFVNPKFTKFLIQNGAKAPTQISNEAISNTKPEH